MTPNGKYLYVSTGPLAYGEGYLYRTETTRPERVRTFPFPVGLADCDALSTEVSQALGRAVQNRR
jgi:hypothetical protein